MINTPTYAARWLVPFILIMLITGCKHTSEALNPAPTVTPTPSPAGTAPQASKDSINEQASATPQPLVNPNDKVSLASAETGSKPEEQQETVKPTATPKPKIDIQEAYNQTKPTLLGLTLKTSPDAVTSKYGKPKEQFQMEDDVDPITVYDYTDFMVGYNKQNQLQFIDIRSSEINPGLNGLKLGQSTSDIYKALGKPDSNTSYVLIYKSKDAVLKLDIDPKTDKLNSIKLFSE
ncbi:DUF4309 domain-containing protein [Paenibacillus sp. UNC451MF]|uniref:DUF4309 domain-containing protein n=1 Tax=Paenibacillus sp. UNC451MF TaxID=1449063 RepID=UPI00068E622E|nr:DUF4309 domain-containing protein [Paenibacillus sp. UNC451MF]